MAKEGFLAYLKTIIDDMVDSSGNIRAIPKGTTGKRNLTNNRIKLLSDIIKLLRDTTIINRETWLYISNKYITIRGVNDLINSELREGDKCVEMGTTLSKIQYSRIKLEGLFGRGMFVDILSGSSDISVYEGIVADQFVKYCGDNDMRKNLLIDIPKDCMATEIEQEEFDEFIKIISPYIQSQVSFIQENISKTASGYFNYLTSMPSLNDIDRERLSKLKMLLSAD